MPTNQLKNASSPYLLQHKNQPVYWREWNPKTLQDAKNLKKPILLSIGYAACHWCHVMAHESFNDPEIAKLINQSFIAVKVDREERPDIDAHYMEALHLMGVPGGWPLTMFLTPDAEPFWGGTYFPKEARGGHVGMREILPQIAALYKEAGESFVKNRDFFRERLRARHDRNRAGEITQEASAMLAKHLLSRMDKKYGGFSGAPKFPQMPMMDFLWRRSLREENERLASSVEKTLESLCQGGIYDHLGGGFARYAVDEAWRVPHFEKMLYDNALILSLLTEVYKERPHPLFKRRIYETVAFLLGEMRAEGGAFAASLDADQEGEEGRFYVWRAEEMDALLGPESAWVKRVYDVHEEGHWEGQNTLHLLHENGALAEKDEARLASARALLLKARGARPRPALDDKILADWNGMAIASLARAAFLFDKRGWMDAAKTAFSFIRDKMTGKGGSLHHSWRLGQSVGDGLAEDYAQMIAAALALYETGGDKTALAQAERWFGALEARHWDDEKGGYRMSAKDAKDVPHARLDAEDGATPSANGVLMHQCPRLYVLTGKAIYAERAARLSAAFGRDAAARLFVHASWLSGCEASAHPVSAVVIGEDEAARAAFRDAWRSLSFPEIVFLEARQGEALPDNHPAGAKGLVGGGAAAYICVAERCSLPITEAEAFRDALKEARLFKEGKR